MKKKILQVNKLYYPWIGGVESVAQLVAEKFKNDFDIKTLVCQPKGRGVCENVNGVEVVRAGSLGIFLSMPISFTFPFLLKKYSKEADIIILHNPFPLGDLSVLLSGFKGKVIIWWHSDIVKQKKMIKLIEPMITRILNRADAIFTTSEGYIEGSAYIGKFREKCKIVPYGIDVSKYINAPIFPILTRNLYQSSSKKILFVGRLVYYKGVDVLIEAFKRVCMSKGGENAELFIVGKGDDEEALKTQAKPIGNNVHFLGVLTDEELKSAFSDCDFFVFPSVEKSEAFGIVQLEAMIYSKPVINTNLKTSVPLVSIHNETGLTVKAGDINELAKAMETLLNHDELRKNLGNAAKERVISQFSLDSMVSNVKKQINNLMEEQ